MRHRKRFEIKEGDQIEVVIAPSTGAKGFQSNKHRGEVIGEPFKYDNGYNGHWKVPVRLKDGTKKDVPMNRVRKIEND